MKLKSTLKSAEVQEAINNRIRNLHSAIEVLNVQIDGLNKDRNALLKEKFELENFPYKDGDKVIFNSSPYGYEVIESCGILEYTLEYGLPRFHVRPYRKDGKLSLVHTRLYEPLKKLIAIVDEEE